MQKVEVIVGVEAILEPVKFQPRLAEHRPFLGFAPPITQPIENPVGGRPAPPKRA
jgi:hypothetical protein